MLENIKVLAHSCIRIEGDVALYFDPYLLEQEFHDADIVFLTHDHYDHFSPEDFAKVANENTLVVAPESILDTLLGAGLDSGSILCMKPGDALEILGIPVEAVPSYNTNKDFHPQANEWLGYIVEVAGQRCYIAGDTDITPENQQVACDVALVPAGGTYTMTAAEAAALVNTIRPQFAIPTHYGVVAGEKTDGATFVSLVDEGIQAVEKLHYDC